MKCEKCGKILPEEIDYCPTCKVLEMNKIKAVEEVIKDEFIPRNINSNNFCSQCGIKLKEEDNFCPGCGKKVYQVNKENLIQPSLMQQNQKTSLDNKSIVEKKQKSKYKSMLFKCILGAVGICAILEIFFILTGELWEVHGKVLTSVWWIIFFGYICGIAISYYEETKYKNLGLAAMSLVAINFLTTTLLTWDVISFESNFIYKSVITFWIILACITHIAFLSLINFKNNTVKKIFSITNLIISITYLLGLIMLIFEIESEFYQRIILVFIILTLFGTAATPLINKIFRNSNDLEEEQASFYKKQRAGSIIVYIILALIGLIITSNLISELWIANRVPTEVKSYRDWYICKGEEVALTQSMISNMNQQTRFSTNKEDLQVGNQTFDYGLIMYGLSGSDVSINTEGCTKMRGSIAFDNLEEIIPQVEVEFRANNYGGKFFDYFTVEDGQVIDFEIDISDEYQVTILKVFDQFDTNRTKLVIGNISFE